MAAGQIIAMIAIIASMYGVDPKMMDCMVRAESDYNIYAENGIHQGLGQYNPDTFEWFMSMAKKDVAFVHSDVVVDDMTDPVSALTLMAWAIKNGYAEHWSTYGGCSWIH
jgi:soluble lytic murein transglycosylase-like protein